MGIGQFAIWCVDEKFLADPLQLFVGFTLVFHGVEHGIFSGIDAGVHSRGGVCSN